MSANAKRRPRRLKRFDEYWKVDRGICLTIDEIIREHDVPFKIVLPRAVACFERTKVLPLGDRTTNRKRLTRAWEAWDASAPSGPNVRRL